jgi:hypothetical protein
MKSIYPALLALIFIFIVSCKKKEGCKDFDAINYDIEAEKDCACCIYEDVIFYAKDYIYTVSGLPYSILSNPIKVYVNGKPVGTVTSVYPNGPGTSLVPGVIVYEPENNKKVEWYAEATLPSGISVVVGSGILNASKNYIQVPVF